MATPNLVNVDEITPKNNSAVLADTNRTDIIDYITIDSTGTSTDFADMTQARDSMAGVSGA